MLKRLKLALKVGLYPESVTIGIPNHIKILNDLGHKRSLNERKPIDKNGNPLPWYTYPAIEYLKQLDFSNANILEFGCGNSTLFYAERCKSIHSIEHNQEWFDQIEKSLPNNAKIYLTDKNSYASYPRSLDMEFDVIIVDGIERFDCLKLAKELIKDTGFIIFDNSERNPEYCQYLRKYDFKQIDFHGFGPINQYAWTTSIFLKPNTILLPISLQPHIPVGGGH